MNDIGFKAAILAAKYFNKHAKRFELKQNCPILDIGAGTGKVGEVVSILNIYDYITSNKSDIFFIDDDDDDDDDRVTTITIY